MPDLEREVRGDEDGLGDHAALRQHSCTSTGRLSYVLDARLTIEKPSRSISFQPRCCAELRVSFFLAAEAALHPVTDPDQPDHVVRHFLDSVPLIRPILRNLGGADPPVVKDQDCRGLGRGQQISSARSRTRP